MADAWGACVHTGEKRAGLLGKLGVNERKDLVAVCGGESVRASRTATPAKKVVAKVISPERRTTSYE